MSEQRDIAGEGGDADADAASATALDAVTSESSTSEPTTSEPPATELALSDPSVSAPAVPVAADLSESAPAPPPPPRPATPGMRLRERREERGIGVQHVTDSLHIEPRLVAALEADDFALFDAPVYARGFLRKYAAFLDLPPDEIVAGYDALHRGPEAPSLIPTASVAEAPRDWSAFKVPAAAAVVVAVIAGSYGWWTTRAPDAANAERAATTVAREVAAPTASAARAEGRSAGAPGDAASDSGMPVADAVADGAPTARATSAAVPEAGAALGTLPAGAPAVVPAPPPRVAGRGALEFRFTADCWIEVYGPAGERRLFDLVRAGETRAVSGPGPWRVFVGYADGVRVSLGGRSVPIPADRRSGSTARFAVAADGSAQ